MILNLKFLAIYKHSGLSNKTFKVSLIRTTLLEQSVPEGLHSLEGTHGGAVLEELQLVGRTQAV